VSIIYGVNVGVLTNLMQIGMEIGLQFADGLKAIAVLSLAGIVGKIITAF
jgi:ammonia channel protein AmtB